MDIRNFERYIPSQQTLFQNTLHDMTGYTVNSGSEMVQAKQLSGKNIFQSTLITKSRGGKIFEFLHFPFQGRADMHHKIQPKGPGGRCQLGGNSKVQCMISKILFFLILSTFIDQKIFFPFLSQNFRCDEAT